MKPLSARMIGLASGAAPGGVIAMTGDFPRVWDFLELRGRKVRLLIAVEDFDLVLDVELL